MYGIAKSTETINPFRMNIPLSKDIRQRSLIEKRLKCRSLYVDWKSCFQINLSRTPCILYCTIVEKSISVYPDFVCWTIKTIFVQASILNVLKHWRYDVSFPAIPIQHFTFPILLHQKAHIEKYYFQTCAMKTNCILFII